MKSSDIVPNEHYAAHLGGHVWEIAEVRVRAMGATPGTVDVEVIHPEGEADDARYDVRNVATKKLLGRWDAKPDPATRQTDHVARSSEVEHNDHGLPLTVWKSFAQHAADEFAKVERYNELATRLTEIGIPRRQIVWLATEQQRRDHTIGIYDPRDVAHIELSPDEVFQLLLLAGNRRSAGQETLAWLVSDFHPQLDGHVPAEHAYTSLVEADTREKADRIAETYPGPRGPLRVYRVVR